MNNLENLKQVLSYVKHTFVGKDEVVELLGIGLIARENSFLLGPPGTAKSAIIRKLSDCIEGGKNFEYLLTKFTEPNEIFGPFDIRKLKEGELLTNTEGMLPEASMIFLDEIFNANSAILNSLLTALNEKIFRRGKELKKLPALMFVGASNVLPEDETLNALLDRFLIRVKCDYVDTDLLESVLIAGWKLENNIQEVQPTITPEAIIALQKMAREINLSPIRKEYIDLIHKIRSTGIAVSDRRAVKIQNLIAASALLCGRKEAILSDLWVLKYIWDNEEQVEILSGMVGSVIEKSINHESHPQASSSSLPNPEDLMKEINYLTEKWATPNITNEEKNIIKDKLRYIQNRSGWVKDLNHKAFINEQIDKLWHNILATI
jgi:MoxR-like ATPase